MTEDPNKLSEEEAIAKVILMEDEYERDSHASLQWYVKRIAAVVAGVGMLILISLFPYILMSKSGSYPMFMIILATFLIAVGICGVLWSQMQEKRDERDKNDPFGF